MKKIIKSFFAGLMILYFSANLQAQSSQQDLDQVELMKYFIGTWEAEMGQDSILIWQVKTTPGKGYEHTGYWKIKGEVNYYGQGLMGFNWGNQHVIWSHMYSHGLIIRDVGQFVTETKLVTKRFTLEHEHATRIIEMNILSPDKYKAVHKIRGMQDDWENVKIMEEVWTRVKK